MMEPQLSLNVVNNRIMGVHENTQRSFDKVKEDMRRVKTAVKVFGFTFGVAILFIITIVALNIL